MRRRAFIGSVFAGLGITGLGAKPPRAKAGDVPMRVFGKTGVQLTVIGQGGARLCAPQSLVLTLKRLNS